MPEDLWNEIPDPPMHYDRLGVPITLRQWCDLVEDPEYKRVASTTVGRWWISTVWLGLDHGFLPGMPRQIFETMVFDADRNVSEDWEMRRYATEDEARQGHEEMVQLVMELENADPRRTQARIDDL
jgi:hypothetical protein